MAVPNVLGVISNLMLENVHRNVNRLHVSGSPILDFIDTVPAEQNLGKPNADGSFPFTAEHVMIFNEGGTVTQSQINEVSNAQAGTALWNVGIGGTNLGLGPDPTESPHPTTRRAVITLKETMGVITLASDQIFADNFGLMIGDFVTSMVSSVIKKLRNWRATHAFTDGTGWIAQVADASVTINDATDAVITLKNGTFRRLEIGERYDIADHTNWPINNPGGIGDTTAAKKNDADVFCVSVNYKNNTAKFRGKAGITPFNALVNNHIVKKGTVIYGNPHVSLCPDGFDNLINDTGSIHGLSRSDFEILQSQIDVDPGAVLRTPQPSMVTDKLDIIRDAGYEGPAFIVSSRSVRSKYAYVQGGQGQFQLPMKVALADGGIGMVQTSYEDQVYNWMLDSFIAPNVIQGLDPKAFTKYAPRGSNVVSWWMEQGGQGQGAPNIFRRITSGNKNTKTFAAEWSSHFNMGILMPFLCWIVRHVKGQKD